MKASNQSLWKQSLLALLTAGLLSIPFLDNQHFYLSWLAFVPLLFAIENTSLKRSYLLGLIAGFFTFALGTFWMQEYLIVAKEQTAIKSLFLASLAWFCSAQVLALSMLIFQWLKNRTALHIFILFPVVIAAMMAVFPMLFPIRLGESQVDFAYALQAIDVVGLAGLDFVIALVNIVLYKLLKAFTSASDETIKKSKATWIIALSIICVWFVYGVFSYHSWEKQMANWNTLKVGLVQPNEDPARERVVRYAEYSQSYPPEMEMSKRLSREGADLIIWPEAQAKNYLNNPRIQQAFASEINSMQTPLLFQDTEIVIQQGELRHINMAIMLDEQGVEVDKYQKMKRIPLGEYIPYADKSPWIKSTVTQLIGSEGKNLIAGTEHKGFAHAKLNIVPIICYETTFPEFVANALDTTADENQKNKSSLLVGLSNDGWFN